MVAGWATAVADTTGLAASRMVMPGVVNGDPVKQGLAFTRFSVTTSASIRLDVPKMLEVWFATGTPLMRHSKVVPGMDGMFAVNVTLSPGQMVSLGDTLMLPLRATGAATVNAISELSPGSKGLLLPTRT